MSEPTHDGTLLDAPTRDDHGLLICEVKTASEDAASRVRRFVGSTALRDRCGDEIMVEGWDIKNYLKNPIVLYGHDYGSLPIGKSVSVEKTDKALMFDVEFAPEAANPLAEQVLRLLDGGFMRAVSVGFRSKASEWIDRNDEDEAKRAKKEPDCVPGKRFTKVELLELSVVPVPANPDSVMQARKKGLVWPDARNVFVVMQPPSLESQTPLKRWYITIPDGTTKELPIASAISTADVEKTITDNADAIRKIFETTSAPAPAPVAPADTKASEPPVTAAPPSASATPAAEACTERATEAPASAPAHVPEPSAGDAQARETEQQVRDELLAALIAELRSQRRQ